VRGRHWAGESCATACGLLGLACNPSVVTNNSDAVFQSLGIHCNPDDTPWWAPVQPSYCSEKSDANYGRCIGYINPPVNGSCQANYWSVQRLCRCGEDVTVQVRR
jgi:hypothetical protein